VSRTTRLVVALGLGTALAGAHLPADAGGVTGRRAVRFRPYNVVVIVLDTSESFQRPAREPGIEGKVLSVEAFAVVERYLKAAAERRQRRPDGSDQYFLVAADAASQLIWSGSREALAGLTPEVLRSKLVARKQFAQCTDIEAALNTAAVILRDHERASEKVVLTFSDLIHEPPVGDYARCAKPSGAPPAGIRWDLLQEASLGFYFVSKEFKYGRPDEAWRKELERRAVRAKFLDAAQTLTADVDVVPPPPARRTPTADEVKEAKTSFDGLIARLGSLLTYAAVGLGAILALAGGAIFVARRRGQRRQDGRNA